MKFSLFILSIIGIFSCRDFKSAEMTRTQIGKNSMLLINSWLSRMNEIPIQDTKEDIIRFSLQSAYGGKSSIFMLKKYEDSLLLKKSIREDATSGGSPISTSLKVSENNNREWIEFNRIISTMQNEYVDTSIILCHFIQWMAEVKINDEVIIKRGCIGGTDDDNYAKIIQIESLFNFKK